MLPIQDELPNIIHMLREPAGDDPRFASLEAIEANRQAFTEKVHSTWKYLHEQSLDEILTIEKLLSSGRKKLPPDFVWYLERTIALWRRINDAIVWALVGHEDHVIRTICHRKDRVRLMEANPIPLRRFLKKINADTQTIVIWSDATSCVDVGDIVCSSFSDKRFNGFFEVKEGVMNDRIFDLMGVEGTPEQVMKEIVSFAEKHGPKAMKQLERVVKQSMKYNQFMDIIDHDRGFDPRRDAEVTIDESTTQLRSYDKELQLIINASDRGPVLRCIDRCLWVYVDRDASRSPKEKMVDFERKLTETSPGTVRWFRERFGVDEPFEPVVLEGNLFVPEAIPLFLRQLEPDTVRDVLLGKLMFSVFLFVDWFELGRIVADLGGELTWSSRKKGRSERTKPKPQRALTLGDRIPRVRLSDGNYIEGFSKIYRVLFDGIMPSSIAAQYVEALRGRIVGANVSPSTGS